MVYFFLCVHPKDRATRITGALNNLRKIDISVQVCIHFKINRSSTLTRVLRRAIGMRSVLM